MATFRFIKLHKHIFETTHVIVCSNVKVLCVFLFVFSFIRQQHNRFFLIFLFNIGGLSFHIISGTSTFISIMTIFVIIIIMNLGFIIFFPFILP